MADRLQPVHRADAPKFKVFIEDFMNTFRYIKPVSYTIKHILKCQDSSNNM